VLDPPNKRIAIDASLYDSRVLAWSLSGDMALRSNYGDNPRFILSVGGFNPRFDPPSDFPELDRVRASLGPPGGNPKLEYYGYFAVTSNTVQAGAGVHLLATAGPAKVEGRLQFDTLIQFDPFGFVVDFLASLSVTVMGKGLSIRLDGTLKGPNPFSISGTIKIEILFFSVTANVDVTLGSGGGEESLPPAKIMPELTEALAKPSNWSAGRPGAANSMVTLREISEDTETVFAHPLAKIGVRQTVVPLEFTLETYGNARPTGLTKFSIDGASVAGPGAIDLGTSNTEQFAPAQFRKLSDQEKLDSPAFQPEVAGRQMRHEGLYLGNESQTNVRPAAMRYESTVIDETKGNRGTPLSDLGRFHSEGLDALSGIESDVVDSLASVSAAANSPLRTKGVPQFRPDEATLEIHQQQSEGIATLLAQSGTTGGESPDGDTTAEEVDKTGGDGVGNGSRGGRSTAGGTFVIASKATLEVVEIPPLDEQPVSKTEAKRALSEFAKRQPRRANELQVVESSRANDQDPSSNETDSESALSVGGGAQYLGGNQ
jgi:hypothetical protein